MPPIRTNTVRLLTLSKKTRKGFINLRIPVQTLQYLRQFRCSHYEFKTCRKAYPKVMDAHEPHSADWQMDMTKS